LFTVTNEKKGSGSSKKLFDVPYKTTDIASIRIADTDLVVVLKNGQRIVVRDGAMRAMSGLRSCLRRHS
jgi:hypothetical protein